MVRIHQGAFQSGLGFSPKSQAWQWLSRRKPRRPPVRRLVLFTRACRRGGGGKLAHPGHHDVGACLDLGDLSLLDIEDSRQGVLGEGKALRKEPLNALTTLRAEVVDECGEAVGFPQFHGRRSVPAATA